MKSRLLDLHHTAKEDLPRILLYSVMVHYIVFYYLFGNPFLVMINRGLGSGGPGFAGQQGLDVELLSPSQVGEDGPSAGEGAGRSTNTSAGKRNFPVFPPEEGADEDDQIEARQTENADSLSEDGINLVEGVGPVSPPKKTKRKPPANMTGPEDCMLKLVGMVCPNGDFDCIEAYKEFCLKLPE